MASDNQAESRLSIDQVPEQISRIFFGKGQGGGRPSYGGMGGAYQSPGNGFGVQQNPGQGFYPNNGGFYFGYEEDLALTMKLGQAALIVFMILSVVTILYLLTRCCLSLTTPSRTGEAEKQNQPAPFTQFPLEPTTSPQSKANLPRSGGVVNLADTESDSASLSSGLDGGRAEGGRSGRGRAGRNTDSTDDGRLPTRFGDSRTNRARSATPRNAPMTSPSTADTVIHVPQPGYMPPGQTNTPAGQRTTPPGQKTTPQPSSHGRQISSNSDRSQPRSLPYYEVPSQQLPSFSTPSKYNSSPPHSPPPPAPLQPSMKPYSFSSNQSKLI